MAPAVIVVAALLLSVVAVASPASAITVLFTGEVVSVGSEIISGPIAVGDPISGSFGFDPAAPDLSSPATIGTYVTPGPFEFAFGSYLGTGGSSSSIQVLDGHSSGDSFGARSPNVSGAPIAGNDVELFRIQIHDPTGTAFDDDSLPTSTPDLSRFTLENTNTSAITLTFIFSAGGTFTPPWQARGRITSLVFVPEPSVAVLAATVAAGLGGCRGRRLRGDDRPRGSPGRRVQQLRDRCVR